MHHSTIRPCLLQRLWVQYRKTTAATPPQHHDRRPGTRVWSDSDGRGSGGTVYPGAYSGRNSAGGGVCYPGRIAMGGPKNQPYHNQPSGASLCSVNRPWDKTAALFVATKIRRNIRRLGGGGRHGQLVTGRSIPMVPPALTPQKHHNQPRFSSVGAESPRERCSVAFCGLYFSEIWPAGGFRGIIKMQLGGRI